MSPLEPEEQDALSRRGEEFSRLLQELARPETAPAADEAWQDVSVAPEELGRFRILRPLGRGGFGVVYEAEDPRLDRRVAIKVLQRRREGGRFDEMLEREAQAVAKLSSHPAIVQLHDFGQDRGRAFLVYELLQGESLRHLLRRGPVPRREAMRILRAVASALAFGHRAGVVHRDLTPGNVFVAEDGPVKVVDFGLALMVGAIGLAAGTPPYAAPEQWAGEAVTPRADVYAWGALAFEVLTGHPLEDDRAVPGWLARRGALASLVRAACSADPDRRPADGGALVEALDRIEKGRRRWFVGVPLTAFAAMAAVVAYLLLRPPAPPKPPRPPTPFVLAVADGDNDSGNPALDGLGTLLAIALQGTEHLEILDHPRLAAVLRASGQKSADRIDAENAGLAAKVVGAAAVLVPRSTREADGFLLVASAVRPSMREPWFEVKERAADPGAVMAAAGRLAGRFREELSRLEPEIRSPREERSRLATVNPEAFRHYYDGILCLDRPGQGAGSWVLLDCGRHFRAALDIDPEFPLAHLELVREASQAGEPNARLRAMLEPALKQADRLPPKDRAQLLAWKSFVEGDVDGALAGLAEARRLLPGDARLAFAAGDLAFRAGRFGDAIEPLRRAWNLDPGLDLALDELTHVMGVLDRSADLRDLVQRLDRSAPSAGTLHAQVLALGWLGEHDAALRKARRAAAGKDPPALEDLAQALVAADRLAEAETVVRGMGAAMPGGRRLLGILLLLEGRAREAAPNLDPPLPKGADANARYVHAYRQAIPRSLARDAAGVRKAADEARASSPEEAATFAALLAYAGDADGALELLPHLEGSPANREVVKALVAWRKDGARSALPALQQVASGDPQIGTELLALEAPWWLVAQCARDGGDDESALTALKRFRRIYFPLGYWRAWTYPRSLVLEATIQVEAGRNAEARDALDRFDRLWQRADPGQPLLAEARALRREIDGQRNTR